MSESNSNDKIEYKLTLIGDTSVGKTCIFKKITTGIFLDKNISTIGMDRRTLTFNIEVEEGGQNISRLADITLVDTAGQERFKSITKSYFKGSDGVLLLYDITNKETFENLDNWISSIQQSIGNKENSKYTVFLLGNKYDLVENDEKKREVTIEEAQKKCKESGLEWGGECSAKTYSDEKFKELFKDFVIKIYKKIGYKVVKTQAINKLSAPKKKKSCCMV